MAPSKITHLSQNRSHMLFEEIEVGVNNHDLVFRLIHFWESRSPSNPTLLFGVDLLLIDEKGVIAKGFIAPSRIFRFQPTLKHNSVYRLADFYAAPNEDMFRVTDHMLTICFTELSTLSTLDEKFYSIAADHFRFQPFEHFKAAADKNGDLYDVIGHIKLIDGKLPTQLPTLHAFCEKENNDKDRHKVVVHLQLREGAVVNVHLWDSVASEFFKKIHASDIIPEILLLTTVHPKRISGRVSLNTMPSTRVFLNRRYNIVSSRTKISECFFSNVTKVETLTLGEIHEFLKKPAKACRLGCIAKIVSIDTTHGWFYISCTKCTKNIKHTGASLVCNFCNNSNAEGHIMYRLVLKVCDGETESTFLLFDRVARELVRIHAADLVSPYLQDNKVGGAVFELPLPKVVLDNIGETHKFEIKVTEHSFVENGHPLIVSWLEGPHHLGESHECSADSDSNGDLIGRKRSRTVL